MGHLVLKDKGSLAVTGFERESVHITESGLHAKSQNSNNDKITG